MLESPRDEATLPVPVTETDATDMGLTDVTPAGMYRVAAANVVVGMREEDGRRVHLVPFSRP